MKDIPKKRGLFGENSNVPLVSSTEQVVHFKDNVGTTLDEIIDSIQENKVNIDKLDNIDGMGRITLKKEEPILSQITQDNTSYIIKSDFDADGIEITMPPKSLLRFEGGSIKNCTIIGQNTKIEAGRSKIFEPTMTISGTWNIDEAYPEWFGAVGDGDTDCSDAINKMLNTEGFNVIKFGNGIYKCNIVINQNSFQLIGSGGKKNNQGYSNTFLTPYDVSKPVIKIDTNSDWGLPNNQINNIFFISSVPETSVKVSNKIGIGVAFNYPDAEHTDSGRVTFNYCIFYGFEKAIYKSQGNLGVVLNYCWIRNCKYGYYAHCYDGTWNEYAGHDYFFHTYFNFCEIGYVLYEHTRRPVILVSFEGCVFESNNIAMFTDTYLAQIELKNSWLEVHSNTTFNPGITEVTIPDYEGNELTIPVVEDNSGIVDIYSINTVFNVSYTRFQYLYLKGISVFNLRGCVLSSNSHVEKDADSVIKVDGGFINNNVPVSITTSPSQRNSNPTSFGGGSYSCMVTECKGIITDKISTGTPIYGRVYNYNHEYIYISRSTNAYMLDEGLSTNTSLVVSSQDGTGEDSVVTISGNFNLAANKWYLFSYEYKVIEGSGHIRLYNAPQFPRTGYQANTWRRVVSIFNTDTAASNCHLNVHFSQNYDGYSKIAIGHAQVIEYNNYDDAYYDFFSNVLYSDNYNNFVPSSLFMQANPNRATIQHTQYISKNLINSAYKDLFTVPIYFATGNIVLKLECMTLTNKTGNIHGILERDIEFNNSDTAIIYLGDGMRINVKKTIADRKVTISMSSSDSLPIVGKIQLGYTVGSINEGYKVYGNGFLLNYGDLSLPNSSYSHDRALTFSSGKLLAWNGAAWVTPDGVAANTPTSGTFADKPTVSDNGIPVGYKYFCTDKQTAEGATNGIEIIHKGSDVWVDALGRAVS